MQNILSSEISNKLSGYMLLYAHQFISYEDMTSTVLYSGKYLLRKNSLLQVSRGFPLMGWPVYTFGYVLFPTVPKPMQTRYGTEIVTNTDITKPRNKHRGRIQKKRGKVFMYQLLFFFFPLAFSLSQFFFRFCRRYTLLL